MSYVVEIGDLKALASNRGWKRLLSYLEEQRNMLIQQLLNTHIDGTPESSARANIVRGRIAQIDDVMKAPKMIMESLERKER